MSDLDEIARKRKMFERYPVLFASGLVIIVLSLILMGWRELNEQALQAQVYAGRGPLSPSQAYLDAARVEQVLHHIIEQLIFVGLAALKLAIGFSIAVIALHLKETGLKSVSAFHKAGVASDVPAMNELWFTRFPKILIAGFATVLFFFLLSFVWVYNEIVPLGDQLTTRMTLEAIIKPGKMIGTGLLLFGIGAGLATIVRNLKIQIHALPNLITAAVQRKKSEASDIVPPAGEFPRRAFVPLFLGLAIVVSVYIPVAGVLAWNRATNLSSSGWSSVGAESLEVILEHWIESYILAGITILLVGIGLWLLEIIHSLGEQRQRFMGTLQDLTHSKPGPAPAPPKALKMVPALLIVGLSIVLLSLLFTAVWIGAGLQAVETRARSEVVADHEWEAFVKPFKFAGLAVVFLGVGIALSLIVVNLQMISMALPGLFARFNELVQGRAPKPLDLSPPDPMTLFPKRLFAGVLVGFAIVVTATVPLAWPFRIGTFDVFIGLNLTTDAAAQAASSLERSLEHLILPYKLAGLAVIFFSIGRYFTTIIGFVRGRKAIVTEGVGAIATVLGSGGRARADLASSVAPDADAIRADAGVAP